jgi:hypothetical protein
MGQQVNLNSEPEIRDIKNVGEVKAIMKNLISYLN